MVKVDRESYVSAVRENFKEWKEVLTEGCHVNSVQYLDESGRVIAQALYSVAAVGGNPADREYWLDESFISE